MFQTLVRVQVNLEISRLKRTQPVRAGCLNVRLRNYLLARANVNRTSITVSYVMRTTYLSDSRVQLGDGTGGVRSDSHMNRQAGREFRALGKALE